MAAELITTFGVETAFAPVFGILAGILTVIWLGRIFNDATLEITIVLSVVHLSYYICEFTLRAKLQALVYDILPSTAAVFSYAIGSRKLSANEQFFVGAQTVVSLLQTTQILSHVCFIIDHVAYASSNKTRIV